MFIDNLNSIIVLLSKIGISFSPLLILRWLLRKNIEFFKLLEEFELKLPPKKDGIKTYTDNQFNLTEIRIEEVISDIEKKDLNSFLKKLEKFEYNKVYFKRNKIKMYSNNLQRIINTTPNRELTISLIDKILNDETGKPFLFNKWFYNIIKF